MNPELVSPPGVGERLDQGRTGACRQETEPASGFPTRRGNAVAGAANLGDGGVHLPDLLRREPLNQCPVDFPDCTFLEERRDMRRRPL